MKRRERVCRGREEERGKRSMERRREGERGGGIEKRV